MYSQNYNGNRVFAESFFPLFFINKLRVKILAQDMSHISSVLCLREQPNYKAKKPQVYMNEAESRSKLALLQYLYVNALIAKL